MTLIARRGIAGKGRECYLNRTCRIPADLRRSVGAVFKVDAA